MTIVRLAIWALLGAALTFGSVYFLDELGLALIIAVVVFGLPMAALRLGARADLIGLAAGPGLLFMVVGELDDAPGLVLIGMAILAASAAVYLSLRRRRPTGRAA